MADTPMKLTEERVRHIRQLRKEGVTQEVLAKVYGVSEATVSHVEHRKTWRHVKP